MIDYPLKDSEFEDIDNRLYPIIEKALDIKFTINEDPKLFDWYCKIRNNLCQQIHNKKIIINK
jgi:hypothetical protein